MSTAGGPVARRCVVALAVLVLGGCGSGGATGGTPAPTVAPPAATAVAPGAASPSAVLDGVELQVTAAHLLSAAPDDPAVQRVAATAGVPVEHVAQMHLVLALRNTAPAERSLVGDALRLDLGTTSVDAATPDVFPAVPLRSGEQVEAAVGFDVVVRPGSGPVTLRWTHTGQATVLPLGGVPLAR